MIWHAANRNDFRPADQNCRFADFVDWLVAKGKTVVLAVNHAYDDAGVQQRLDAIEYAMRRWGSQVRFSEYRPLYAGARSVIGAARDRAAGR